MKLPSLSALLLSSSLVVPTACSKNEKPIPLQKPAEKAPATKTPAPKIPAPKIPAPKIPKPEKPSQPSLAQSVARQRVETAYRKQLKESKEAPFTSAETDKIRERINSNEQKFVKAISNNSPSEAKRLRQELAAQKVELGMERAKAFEENTKQN